MGILTSDEEGHVESIVYFLTEALRAAVENGDSVHQSLCEAPQLSPNMSCDEITDRLAAYRRHSRAIWSYEALMVAKIMRARELAKELRGIEAELRPELDIFRLATVSCADLQEILLPSAQNIFNGVDQRSFNDRGTSMFDGARADPLSAYRIAGHTDITLLLGACEALHFALAARYGMEALPMRFTTGERMMEEPLLLDEAIDEIDDEAFLLTDFCEVLPDAPAPAGVEWRGAYMGSGLLPN
jgi:hypothetical protein